MTSRRLIVNADDFGRSPSINEAVIRAHREGILTSASLMVNEPASEAAVELARQNPSLGIGLHLTLALGRAALSPREIPGLVNERGEFSEKPFATGFSYFFRTGLREQMRKEIHAQFARFRATGLPLDHVDGHLHFHLHPAVFGILWQDAEQLGIRHLRLTREPFWMDALLVRGRRWYRAFHAMIFFSLVWYLRLRFSLKKFRHTQRVFGLLEDSHVDEQYLLKLLPALPPGDSELYSHPSLDKFKHEFDALVSPRLRELMEKLGIERIRYRDL
jgi:hopanoid biosynthesis associated protein HpnK